MKRSWSRIFALTLGIPLLLAILVACGGTGTTGGSGTSGGGTTSGGIIKIATDLPVSGAEATDGKPAENGAHLALDQANANHTIPGYTLVFDPQDDVGASGVHDPAVGAANVTKLIGDAEVAGIIGPFNSSVAQSEMPIANEAPIVLISPSNTNTCLTQNTPDTGCTGANDMLSTLRPTGKVTYFRIATTDNHQGAVGADFLYKTQGYKTAYVIDDTETYGVGLATQFIKEWQADGGKLLGHDSIKSTTDYTGELTKIAALKPDVIYFAGVEANGGLQIRKQMATTPGLTNTPFAGGDGIQDSAFATAIGTKTGGPVFSTVAAVDVTKVPSAANFIQQYQAKYGPLGAYSASGYDCAQILILAIKAAIASGAKPPTSSSDVAAAQSFRQAVIDQVAKTNYNGVTGHQSFDANGDTTNKTISVYQLADVNGSPGWEYKTAETLP
jgi:branched-chain amino acid transport system substrate-binding protein